MDSGLCAAFMAVADLCIETGNHPLQKHAGCWEYQIDDQWFIAVNGHQAPMLCSKSDVQVDPFCCYVMFNGWPAGIMNPIGGQIAAGAAANESTFIAAFHAATERAKAAAHG